MSTRFTLGQLDNGALQHIADVATVQARINTEANKFDLPSQVALRHHSECGYCTSMPMANFLSAFNREYSNAVTNNAQYRAFALLNCGDYAALSNFLAAIDETNRMVFLAAIGTAYLSGQLPLQSQNIFSPSQQPTQPYQLPSPDNYKHSR